MPIDPSIPLQVQPFKTESSANQLAMMESAAKLGEYQQNIQRTNALRGLDRTDPNYINKVYSIDPKTGMALEAHASTIKKETAQAGKAESENISERIKLQREKLANVSTPEQFLAWSNSNHDDPVLGPYFASQGMTREKSNAQTMDALNKPGGFQQLLGSAMLGAGELYKRNNMTAAEKGNLAVAQYNATKPQFSAEFGGYVAPPTKDNPNGKFTQVTNAQGEPLQSLKSLNPQESAVISQAIVEGRLDPNAVNSRNQKTIATTLLANPTANLVGLHGDVVNTNASARTTGTQQGKVTSAANEAGTMLGLVKTYSDAVDRTQYPSLNAIQNAVSKGTGDQNIIRFNTAINSAVNAYARAINPNGIATVADKNHARELLTNAYSKGQTDAALEVMQQEVNAAKASPSAAHKQLNPGGAGNKSNAPASAIAPPSGFTID
jgi:hypothetical protein